MADGKIPITKLPALPAVGYTKNELVEGAYEIIGSFSSQDDYSKIVQASRKRGAKKASIAASAKNSKVRVE